MVASSSSRPPASAAAVETPARPVRSNRRQIASYNESSSSDSEVEEEENTITTATTSSATWRRASSRRQTTQPRSAIPALSTRPKRTVHKPRTYQEPSSDEDLESVIARFPEMVTTPDKNSQSAPRPPRSSARLRNQHTEASAVKRKRAPVHSHSQSPRKRRQLEPSTEVNESAPPWQTLPYQVLLSIFLYAFAPLDQSKYANGPETNAKKLLDIALLCRSFAEPALSALYHTLVFSESLEAHKISSLLAQPNETLSVNYPAKVQEIIIDVRGTLVYKTGPTFGYFDLAGFIQWVPHIKTLRLFDPFDGKRPFDRSARWAYPSALFEVLRTSNIRLRTFDWNTRYTETLDLLDLMLREHPQTPFQGIRTLNLFHIHSTEVALLRFDDNAIVERKLGEALGQLPELQAVSFTDCGVVNDSLIGVMPPTLRSLTLDNCDEISTAAFSMYLRNSGSCLRELIIKHNRHLNLSFMPILKDTCPNLELLSADFLMHNWPPQYNGMPHFKFLFKKTEVPTWPSKLREIELLQLRQLDKVRATTFLTSLVDAAPELPDLRKIVIVATVEMQWQDRASFRQYWVDKLEHTFLRKDPPPLDGNRAEHTVSKGEGRRRHSNRHSARIATQRLAGIDASNYEDELEVIGADDEGANGAKSNHKNSSSQGMCDSVYFQISNLRPAENQYNEGDFLDSERSGDEDWDGEDWEPEHDPHAW